MGESPAASTDIATQRLRARIAALAQTGDCGFAELRDLLKQTLDEAGDPAERRVLNVVEEMAIASGVRVPPVYIMEDGGINAFAAGNSEKDGDPSRGLGNQSRPARRSGIADVDLPVHQSIESHRRGPCSHQADQNPENYPPARHSVRGHEHRRQAKGQGKHRMLKLDKFRPAAES